MKGCNLRCLWCHNPESFNRYAELEFFAGKCTACGRCVSVCPEHAVVLDAGNIVYNRELCKQCFSCADACLNDARVKVGDEKDSADIMKIVLRDMPFYKNSGGGVTFSGGEPMLQTTFLLDMLKIAKDNNIHTAVETAGNVDAQSFEMICGHVDLFLYDIKLMNSKKHKEATSVSNERILDNLQWLDKSGAKILVRIPVIPGMNDDAENMKATAVFLMESTSIRRVELLPYHNLADHKYAGLGLEYPTRDLPPLPAGRLDEWNEIFRSIGISGET